MRSPLRLSLLAVALAALAACGRSVPPVPGDAPPAASSSDFSVYELDSRWRDQEARDRDLGSLSGKARVVAMVYTRCAHTCPLIVSEMKHLEAALPAAERERVGFVLVSLDPARDTPAQLAEFAGSMRLDPARWTLLTGDGEAVRELAAVLGIRYRPEAGDRISHSNSYLVLDGAGRIVHRQDGLGEGTGPVLARIRAATAAARSPRRS
ncbi:MAG TPA: SCO family protein [Longimicrobiaceae bacterium]